MSLQFRRRREQRRKRQRKLAAIKAYREYIRAIQNYPRLQVEWLQKSLASFVNREYGMKITFGQEPPRQETPESILWQRRIERVLGVGQ